jgi:hypothetical protein
VIGEPFELGADHTIIMLFAITEVVGGAGTAGMKALRSEMVFE